MSPRNKYIDLVQRHLGRRPAGSDGYSVADLQACEVRLKLTLPSALRGYYLLAGRIESINLAHNILFSPMELKTDGGYLWFMEENQAVVHWGLRVADLSQDDPIVCQRANVDGAEWYSEELPLSDFLIRVFDWQAGFSEPPN